MRSDFLSRGRRAGAAALARSAEALTRAGQIAGAGGHPRVALTRVLALAFALALVTSAIAPGAVAATASSGDALERGPPDGMVGVPGDRVGAVQADSGGGGPNGGPPADAGPPGDVGPPSSAKIPTDAAAWSPLADKHAGSLNLSVGETSEGRLALVFSDAENHAGREVAVRRDTLATALGHEPAVAHGLHESGERWTSSVRYEGEYAVLEVPKFSSNTVTFDGQLSLSGSPATDGASYTYDVDSLDAVSNYSIDVTGHRVSEERTASGTTPLGSSESIDVGGTTAPTGHGSATTPTLSVTADASESASWSSPSSTSPIALVDTDSTGDPRGFTEIHFPNPPSSVSNVTVNISSGGYTGDVAVYAHDGALDQAQNGTQVATTSFPTSSGEYTFALDSAYNADPSNGLTLEFVGQTSVSEYQATEILTADDSGSAIYRESSGGTWTSSQADASVSGSLSSVSASDDQGESVSFGTLTDGESQSTGFDLSTSSSSLSFNGNAGKLSWTLDYTVATESVDPTVTVNGHETAYSGTLADGETASLSADTGWIENGTNTVDVSVAPNAGAGPTGRVGFEYNHSTVNDQTVTYEGEAWSERYNVSKTWASARSNTELTIPFDSSRVVSVRNVQVRRSGGSWSDVDAANQEFDGTNLTVELGDVDADETTEVRANGTKVQVSNGAIEVLDPTTSGNSLDSKIKITDHSEGFEIDVSGTVESEFVHYTHSESWTSPEPSTVHEANGSQLIYLPNARAGSSTRVASYPLEVNPDTGKVEVEMVETDSSPVFKVDPRDGADSVEYRYHNTKSGDKYVLYSQSHSIARDTATASSPVSLFGSSVTETLEIFNADSDNETSSTSSGGGGGAIGAARTTANGVNPLLVLFASGALVLGLAYSNYRWSIDPRLTGGAATVVALLALEIVSPGTISSAIGSALTMLGSALSEQVGFIVVLGLPFSLYLIYKWWQTRSKAATTPDTEVTFQLRGRDK